jgi:hypothetical protein
MIIFIVSAAKTLNSLFYPERRGNVFFQSGG